ncbi:MAG: hypothetical protein MUO43_00200, partial [Desulfobacterales bacterium]|nr:hypothetical protein [Desulfobacterales bacterium]
KICVHPRLSAVNNKLIPASIFLRLSCRPLSPSLSPGARLDLLRLVLWCGGRRFSIISAVFGC